MIYNILLLLNTSIYNIPLFLIIYNIPQFLMIYCF